MTIPARSLPLGPVLDRAAGGELVQSLTYREAYSPAAAPDSLVYDSRHPRRHADAPGLLRGTAAGAWALVSVAAAGSVLVVLVLVLARIVGWLT